jgi:hypothetical protein
MKGNASGFSPHPLSSPDMFVRFVKFWILISTLASVAGWTLSALGVLNRTGYLIFVAVVAVLVFLFRKSSLCSPLSPVQEFGKFRRRFRRFLPASFALLALLVFVSGLIYEPTNHTGLSYRLPRALQWLQHGHWVWIHTPNYRMNDRACGIEWLSAPLLLFLKSDRALFLLNFIPFLLMPGLIFSVWTRMGVRPRVAWNWMWLVPTGYCFLLQSGGIANDAFPTVYALAMMDFALRAREKNRGSRVEGRGGENHFGPWTSDLGLSLLSAALLVGAKASNLPLGLPWLLVLVPVLWRLLSRRSSNHATRNTQHVSRFSHALTWLAIFAVALLASFIPSAILNMHYLNGDWSGLSIEHEGMNMKNPLAGILGNAVLLVTNNFVPTFFPMAGWWNQHALSVFPGALVRLMNTNFEAGYEVLGEMPTEDNAGIGFGISVLMVISVVAGRFLTRNAERGTRNGKSGKRESGKGETADTQHATRNTLSQLSTLNSQLVLAAPWLALLAYCMKSGMVTPGRLITPYYPLLFPLLLAGAGQSQIVRRCWWRILAGGVVALAFAALIVNPSRPLWPAKTITAKLVARYPGQPKLARAQKVYEVYGHRADPMPEVRQWFPPGLKVIGFMGFADDLDISLWKPYGSRRVEPFLISDSPEAIRKLGIEYAVVSGLALHFDHVTIEEWLQKNAAELIESTTVTTTVSMGPQPWYFVRFKK